MSACGFYETDSFLLVARCKKPAPGIVVTDAFTPLRRRFDEIIHPRFRVYTTLCPFYGQMNANFNDAGRTLTIK